MEYASVRKLNDCAQCMPGAYCEAPGCEKDAKWCIHRKFEQSSNEQRYTACNGDRHLGRLIEQIYW